MGYKIAHLLIRLLVDLVARVEVEGEQNLPQAASFIAASNHLGRLDVTLIYYLLDRQDIILLVAEKYRESAIYRWFVKQLDAIWVDRFNADFGALRAALSRLRKGGVLVLAPEGTRSPTGALLEARPGTGFLASKSGVPVLPVALIGTQDSLVKESLLHLRRARVTVRLGEAFTLPALKSQDREATLQQYTDEIMCRIAALLPPENRGVYAGHPRLKELLESGSLKASKAMEVG